MPNTSRVTTLVRKMQNAPDFGYDDAEVELTRILAAEGNNWLWAKDDRGRDVVKIVPHAEYVRIAAERGVAL